MFLDAAQLILQVTDKLAIWPRITLEITQIKFMSTHANSLSSKKWINDQSVKKITNMSKSEAVVIESIEVREMLSFLFYLDILNKLSLLQRKHSKYMYARCLNFPCFITYLVACMHAFCMFYLYVSLEFFTSSRIKN